MQRCTLLGHKAKDHLLVCIQTIWAYSPDLAGGERKGAGEGQRPKPNQQLCSADTKGPSFIALLYCTNPQHLRIWWHHFTVFHGEENRKPWLLYSPSCRAEITCKRTEYLFLLPYPLSLVCLHVLIYPFSPLLTAGTSKVLALTSSIVRSSGTYLSQLEKEISLLQAVCHGQIS